MSLALSHTRLQLGLTDDIDSALNVDLIPVSMPVINTTDGTKIQAAFCEIDSDKHLQRIIALLKPLVEQQLTENNIDFSVTPVYWLLPELAIEDKQPLIDWANILKEHFPMLFSHPKTQFFPFGSSAIVMALKTAEQTLSKTIPHICLIAVDSLYHQLEDLLFNKRCLTAQNNEGLIPSEGAIMTCVSVAEHGINVLASHSERSTAHQITQSIESLFFTMAKYLKQQQYDGVINSLYTPSNGLPENTLPWMEAYRHLAGHVNQQTQLKQLPLLTGELGCVTGLYHFLHIYNVYQHAFITGNILQLEMSTQLYQTVNLYSWTGKE